MTLYIGVDFHPHQQTVSYCRSDEGEVHQASLVHNVEQVRRFYKQLPKAVVGIEASCTAAWFEQMLIELGDVSARTATFLYSQKRPFLML